MPLPVARAPGQHALHRLHERRRPFGQRPLHSLTVITQAGGAVHEHSVQRRRTRLHLAGPLLRLGLHLLDLFVLGRPRRLLHLPRLLLLLLLGLPLPRRLPAGQIPLDLLHLPLALRVLTLLLPLRRGPTLRLLPLLLGRFPLLAQALLFRDPGPTGLFLLQPFFLGSLGFLRLLVGLQQLSGQGLPLSHGAPLRPVVSPAVKPCPSHKNNNPGIVLGEARGD